MTKVLCPTRMMIIMQLTQASGLKMSNDDDWSTVMGSTPVTQGSSSNGTAIQEEIWPAWQWLQTHKSGTIYTHSYLQTNKHMYDWILLDTCSINLIYN